ncbi:GNAT family N-acetyltransferase [Clostridium botulinum]|uniref:GNAT family N-acetyltransferase n=1 Tax=Clostridium botulinum TaxID=1491 RepID=A0A6B4JPK2_CLOBO|nr:GNAT family protein [Clostridium botulinum]EES49975.1 acetyltransferase, GNAT family [Clostridium botulinum E1 str. 'BoNT E Beluga']MBY6762427.1 GNAT family N-acetyltransferase [Clostridium botulinum]MBY6921269.1 GNAT family N-acetyltransferase [Clostridium botulinum]MCR1131872.1 GNAT family N-acetyltransferase [Clostridium botulinum]NFH69196.1 GNAT family N-acetyltransferase [Clostridium botulinum]
MLKGEKVYLRLMQVSDIKRLYDLANDYEVKKYNDKMLEMGKKIQINEGTNNINIYKRKALSIINKKNVLVGFMTYKQSDYCKNVYSIGITIGKKYWNRGYGQDSIKTLIKYLFDDLNAKRIQLEVVSENIRAIKCYKKCGFIEEKIRKARYYMDGKYTDIIIMGILKKR